MNYQSWLEQHIINHKKILEQLNNLSNEEIIEYFDYKNISLVKPDFCPLFKNNQKCHNLENLNCYLCACPYFRFKDEGFRKKRNKIVYSYCVVNSKFGKEHISQNSIHQDCSNCFIPHIKKFIKDNFDKDLEKIMSNCRTI